MQLIPLAPTGVLAQVQGARVAGQSAVAGQETGQFDSFSVGEQRLDVHNVGGGTDGGHETSRVQAEAGRSSWSVTAPACE